MLQNDSEQKKINENISSGCTMHEQIHKVNQIGKGRTWAVNETEMNKLLVHETVLLLSY